MKRFSELKLIANLVGTGQTPIYHDVHNRWSLFRGRVDGLGKQDEDAPGWTMVLRRPMMSTQVKSIEIDTIVDTLLNHEENYEKFVEIDEGIGKYLSSPEGRWGIGS